MPKILGTTNQDLNAPKAIWNFFKALVKSEKYEKYLRHPIDNIQWTGTETATEWNGYMEGAVRSRERVAAEGAEGLKN